MVNIVQNNANIGTQNITEGDSRTAGRDYFEIAKLESLQVGSGASADEVKASIEEALKAIQAPSGLPADVQAKAKEALDGAAHAANSGQSPANQSIKDKLDAAATTLTSAGGLAGAGLALAKVLLSIGKWVVGVW
jgi:hypothetical protein